MSRTSLSRRLPLLMAGVATIAVLLGALVAWPLLRAAADSTAESRPFVGTFTVRAMSMV